MKYEWRKQEKELYFPKNKPGLVNIKEAKYFCINGVGNPNNEEFSDKVSILYQLSYAVKMMPKKGYTPNGYFEYTVYPLEGLWDIKNEWKNSDTFNKDELIYTIMVKQPSFVNEDVFNRAVGIVKNRNKSNLVDNVYFDTINDGLSVQMLHIGSYDNEEESFKIMRKYIEDNNLEISNFVHREIYLSDARKTKVDNLKTVLRYRLLKNKDFGD